MRADHKAYMKEVEQEFDHEAVRCSGRDDITDKELLRIAQFNVKLGRNHEDLLDAADRYSKCKKQDEEREERKRKRAADSGDDVCMLCAGTFRKRATVDCEEKHAFCETCIRQWAQKSREVIGCPTCFTRFRIIRGENGKRLSDLVYEEDEDDEVDEDAERQIVKELLDLLPRLRSERHIQKNDTEEDTSHLQREEKRALRLFDREMDKLIGLYETKKRLRDIVKAILHQRRQRSLKRIKHMAITGLRAQARRRSLAPSRQRCMPPVW